MVASQVPHGRWASFMYVPAVMVGSLGMLIIALVMNLVAPGRRYPTFWCVHPLHSDFLQGCKLRPAVFGRSGFATILKAIAAGHCHPTSWGALASWLRTR